MKNKQNEIKSKLEKKTKDALTTESSAIGLASFTILIVFRVATKPRILEKPGILQYMVKSFEKPGT